MTTIRIKTTKQRIIFTQILNKAQITWSYANNERLLQISDQNAQAAFLAFSQRQEACTTAKAADFYEPALADLV